MMENWQILCNTVYTFRWIL